MAATESLDTDEPEKGSKPAGRTSSTTRYVVGRVVKAFLTIYVVATAIFFLVRLLPGNPVDVYINQQIAQYGMSYQEASNAAAGLFSFDPNESKFMQYLHYLGGLVQGDLGTSLLSPGSSVTSQIGAYLPWTLFSVGIALIISFVLGIGIGMAMAYRRGGIFDHAMTLVASITHSIPNFLLAMMIIVFFGVQLEWLPIANMRGAYSPGVHPEFSLYFLSDAFYHAALPMFVYVLTSLGGWMLVMKSSTVETLGEDYVTVARARGLTDRRIQVQYVGRNAMLPLFTSFVLSLGFVVGGSILVEQVTQYQGIGFLLYEAVQRRDYPVLQGILLIVTISVVLANLVADLLYSRVDPRIRITSKEG
ncbi:peptide/nickel transport system permease protein [Actinopolymorpha cephalotaxi]|uniref:Peptide/nickel transport system permease protein n=1 Tax=Actinopolymorpha cephalotaxi TaxID=504797 RepID=A0A1I2PJB4_9ACTN|nr:ABC transporter permease [Actinopolymorpha cephalotaxi]NYH83582.1 peptide/nickel transport system permease protein [Actinopolymorpha cephalotaxi]SFG16252.1 peptide/nickel transport system permease protein [Actinopolymorpha cephalotaxi]